jgi:1-deoxyxylulose-5-phosphate synthase
VVGATNRGALRGGAAFDVVDVVAQVARERGLSSAQVSLAWLLGKRAVTAPIVGATKLQHLEEAISAVEIRLIDEDAARLEAPYRPHPIVDHS